MSGCKEWVWLVKATCVYLLILIGSERCGVVYLLIPIGIKVFTYGLINYQLGGKGLLVAEF